MLCESSELGCFNDVLMTLKYWPTVRKQPRAADQPESVDHLLSYSYIFRAIS